MLKPEANVICLPESLWTLILRQRLSLSQKHTLWPGWLAAGSKDLPSSSSDTVAVGMGHRGELFSVSAGDLNPSPHAHAAVLLPTEPSPVPSIIVTFNVYICFQVN